jgi:hypothetical protein
MAYFAFKANGLGYSGLSFGSFYLGLCRADMGSVPEIYSWWGTGGGGVLANLTSTNPFWLPDDSLPIASDLAGGSAHLQLKGNVLASLGGANVTFQIDIAPGYSAIPVYSQTAMPQVYGGMITGIDDTGTLAAVDPASNEYSIAVALLKLQPAPTYNITWPTYGAGS